MTRGKLLFVAIWAALPLLLSGRALAATATVPPPTGNFNLQVSPSPLVTTVKPGIKTTVELKVHNASTGTEYLQIAPRPFTYDSATGKVDLKDTVVAPEASWITFSAPKFTVASDQTYSQEITFDVPAQAGFSYSFALVITRQNNPAPQAGTRAVNGSLAVFSLVNIDRPGAKSQLQVVNFTSDKKLYEYPPVTLSVRFNNTGNTIVQPAGNIFIQRTTNTKTPIATLSVNKTQGYILPGTQRTMTAEWNDGFATYTPTLQADGSTKNHLTVDWSKLKEFRIGRYTAKLVAVYSDGQHDVPIEGTVTFWVIPWRAILLLIAIVVLLWLFFRWRGRKRTEKAVQRALAARDAADKPATTPKKADKGPEKAS